MNYSWALAELITFFCNFCLFLKICVPMSVEFEELLKARDNPSEEAQSKSLGLYLFLFWGQLK